MRGSMQSPPLSGQARGAFGAILGIAALLVVSNGAIAAGNPDHYTLGVSDKLSIRVVEWQSAGATYQDWTAVTGSYLVGREGAIACPFGG